MRFDDKTYWNAFERLTTDAKPERIPYIDEVGNNRRIFVSCDNELSSWEEWKKAADIATAAHFLTQDILTGELQRRTNVKPLAKHPEYLIDSNGAPEGWRILMNVAAVHDEQTFERVLTEARAKLETMSTLYRELGAGLCSVQTDWHEGTKYNSRDNAKNDYAFIENYY